MSISPPQHPPVVPRRSRLTGRRGSQLLVVLLAGWVLLVTFVAQWTAWFQVSLAVDPGDPVPWLSAALAQLVLIGLPVGLLAWRWPVPRYRAIFRSWAWALGYFLLLTPTRLFSPVEGQTILLLQILVTLGVLAAATWAARRQREFPRPPLTGIGLALAGGAALLLPWAVWGALGSPLDLVLAGLLAAGFGATVAAVLRATWIPAMRRDPRRPRRDRLTGGLALSIALLIMASGLGFNGVQLLLMLALPAAAWAIVATGAPGWAAAAVALGPLAAVDPDTLLLAVLDPQLIYALFAAMVAVVIGWVLGGVGLLPEADPVKFVPRPAAWTTAGLLLLVAALVYGGAGFPGFHGDRVFVMLADQADLSDELPDDLVARRTQVYQTLTAHAATTQAELRGALDRLGVAYTPYYLVNGLEVEAGLPLRLWLQSRAEVAAVMTSPVLRPVRPFPLDPTEAGVEPTFPQWNLTDIGANRVWTELGVTGAGIVIGQSDSGVQGDHPEFSARYRGATSGDDYNWLDPWNHTLSPTDEDGHGTHTLGSVLGEQVGVAPGATWFACANLVRNLGSPAKYLDCMQFMLAPYPQGGDPLVDGDPSLAADVLNNSWGCPTHVEGCTPAVLGPAVEALTRAGIFVVVSAGNSGPTCATITDPPAIYPASFTVGAVDAEGELADFSSTGPVLVDGSGRVKPDLLAPGVDVLSAWPGSGYAYASGTSMAGPHVAGVVALMWSANPALRGDVAQTRTILAETAQPFAGTLAPEGPADEDFEIGQEAGGAVGTLVELADGQTSGPCLSQVDLTATPNVVAGYGVVDAYAAVQAARSAP